MATWVDRVRLQFDDAASKPYKAAGRAVGQANQELKKSALSMEAAFKAVAGAWATQKMIQFGTQSVRIAMENQLVQAKLEGVIRSTGGAAGVSAKEMNAYGKQLQKSGTYAGAAITDAQALLATFTQIKGTSFHGATQAVLDIAKVMGGDLQASALQVGKALNAPLEGMSALSRVGVSFNEVQKRLIKSHVEAGRVAEAQAIILKELQVEFGGADRAAAQTAAGGLLNMHERFQDMRAEIGERLIPIVSKLGENFLKTFDIITGKVDGVRTIELMDEGQIKHTIGLIDEAVAAQKKLGPQGKDDLIVRTSEEWREADKALRDYIGSYGTLGEAKARLKARELELPKQAQAALDADAANKRAAAEAARFKGDQDAAKMRQDAAKSAAERAAADEAAAIVSLNQIRDDNLQATHEGRLQIIANQYETERAMAAQFGLDIQEIASKRDRLVLDEETKNAEAQIALAEKTADEKKAAADREKDISNAQAGYAFDVANSYAAAGKLIVGSNKKNAAALKAIGLFEAGVNGARAVLQAMTLPPPVAAFAVPAAIAAAGVQAATIATAKYAAGGLPSGRNAMIQVNEQGQESVLNSRATSRLGVAGVTALNSGAPYPGRTTNEISYAPVYHFAGGAAPDILAALENDKNRFASFLTRLQKRGYLATAGVF